MPGIRRLLPAALVPLLVPAALLAQHAFTPEEIADGARIFQAACTTCHGDDGAAVPGVPLGAGSFRGGATDEDAIGMIRNGIPGTGMPGFGNISEEDAAKIVAFLRGAAPTAALDAGSGDPVRGRDIFRSGGCLNCHRVNGEGGRLGPDLSRIGAPPVFAGGFGAEPPPDISPEDRLELALLEPNAEFSDGNRTFQVVTRDQTTLRGRLMSHDTFTLSLLDADGDRLVTFRKAELESFGMIDSPMPSYRDRLDASQLADVISYLLSLRGPGRR